VHGLRAAGLDEPVVPRILPFPVRVAIPLAAAAALGFALLAVRSFAPPARDAHRIVAEMPSRPADPAPRAGLEGDGLPLVHTLAQDPYLGDEQNDLYSLGMAHDQYVMDQWELREPAGGGVPVLIRVGASSEARVKVTF